MLAYCYAMIAFCRQRARFAGEDEAFWIKEASEWQQLISGYADTLANDETEEWYQVIAARTAWPFRYRCPKAASQRDQCQGPCELLVERA